ncbi:hypothetical protein GUJ93_ZPchr0014g46696 [Zizania palustris]|uniref:Cyclin n=1 Tax=Zizania palustris TaxID=103762 RepID=A0A8J5SXQ4_ZIZPA|nr:hypothetical protein GUJ93_ZPchr0014g46696 [Zizania palustris]
MAGEEDLRDMPRVVGVLSALLERVTERNDAAADAAAPTPASAFRATTKPDISVRAYMARIARFAGCSPRATWSPTSTSTASSGAGARPPWTRTACTVSSSPPYSPPSSSWMICECYSNAYFAKVGGVSLQEMNYLEVDFLFAVGFDLNVSPEAFGHCCTVLRSEMLCLELERAPPMHCCLADQDDTPTTTTAPPAAAASSTQHQLAA